VAILTRTAAERQRTGAPIAETGRPHAHERRSVGRQALELTRVSRDVRHIRAVPEAAVDDEERRDRVSGPRASTR
jgi:hypothetical protein